MNMTIDLNETISISLTKLSNEPFIIFLSMNIVQLFFSLIGIIGSIFFIVIVRYNRSIHTVSNILTCNSSLAVLMLSIDMFSISMYILYRDFSLKKVKMHNMFLCHVRGYISHISFCSLVHSFVIQAFYRLAGIIYYNRLYYQSLHPYLYAIVIQWIISIVQVLPIVLMNKQVFIEEEYLCQISIDNSRSILYVCTIVYFIPLPLIFIQYLIIAKYSRRKDNECHSIDIQQRARRQMKLIRHIFILITILLILGTPYCTIIVLDALSLISAPNYAHRLGFLFVAIAAGSIMLTMIYFTPNLRRFLLGKRKNTNKYKLKSKNNEQQIKDTIKKFRNILQSETIEEDNLFR